MVLKKFQRTNSTFPFSDETVDTIHNQLGYEEFCIHEVLYGPFDLEIVCSDGECGVHQVVLGHASKMMKDMLIGDTLKLENGEELNVINTVKDARTIFLPDIKTSTVNNLLSVLYTGNLQ